MSFFAARNLVTQTVAPCIPWEYQPAAPIPAQVRGNKQDRQDFYQNVATEHNFYTGLEGINPNMRVSRENPPHKLHAVSADFDLPIPEARVSEVIRAMKLRPAWVERSLGGNLRLIWLLRSPLVIGHYDFCTSLLQGLVEHLSLNLLPGLDEAAFTTPSRLLANGCNWTQTGFGAIDLQAYFVNLGRNYRFQGEGNNLSLPLDVAETAIRAKYPNFNWPTEFIADSQGPSWFVPGSESALSAIVKPEGIFTFAAHAARPFYSWADLLGADFVKTYRDNSISKATADIWWDGKRFWRRINGNYTSSDLTELTNFFRVDCRLSNKAAKPGEPSQLDLALAHIYNSGRIESAAPFVFRPAGLITFLGDRKLNTYLNKALSPAIGTQTWGEQGNFSFISLLLTEAFDPVSQLAHWLAWFKHYYTAAFECFPAPGQNTFLMGGPGIGKTLINREIVGVSVGGYADASDYLVEGNTFNSHLVRVPHWCLDDDSPSASVSAQARFHAIFKKTAANQQVLHHKKFEVPGMAEWMGRIGATTNLDYVSSRLVGPLDNGTLDKVCLFRCPPFSRFEFPSRKETIGSIQKELPHFLRFILDWVPPDEIERDSRYGYAAYQDARLLDQSHQSSTSAPFKEVLIETLTEWFAQNKTATEWVGTISGLMKMIMLSGGNEFILRSMRLESVSRYLEQVAKEGLLKCETENGPLKTRIWKFKREKMV